MGWTRAEKIVPLLVVFLLGAGLMPGCSSGGGDNPVENPPCLRFDADSAPTSGEVTARRGSASTCDQLVLEIVVTDVADIWTVGAVVTYPNDIMTYRSMDSSETFLAEDGNNVIVEDGLDSEQDNGDGATSATISISRTLLTEDNISATGQSLFAALVFRRLATGGSGSVTFSGEQVWEAGDPSEAPFLKNPQPDWSGGAVSVTR